MDVKENMDLDSFEKVIEDISERNLDEVPLQSINEDMVLTSITKQFDNNRTITVGVNLSILNLLKDELEQYG